MNKLISFWEHYVKRTTAYLLSEWRGELVKIDWDAWRKIWPYFVRVHDSYHNLFYNMGGSQYSAKKLSVNKEKEIYNVVTNAFCSDKKWYLYLLKCRELYKIWITNNFSNRITQYKTSNPFDIETVFYIEIYWNSIVEKHIIDKFSDKNVKGREWFCLQNDDINYIKKLCLTSSSLDEWSIDPCAYNITLEQNERIVINESISTIDRENKRTSVEKYKTKGHTQINELIF